MKSMSHQEIEGNYQNSNKGNNINNSSSKNFNIIGSDDYMEKISDNKYNDMCQKLYNANELFELAQMIKKQKQNDKGMQS